MVFQVVPDRFSDKFLEENVNDRYVEKEEHLLRYQSFVLDPSKPSGKLPVLHKKYRQLSSKEKRQLGLQSLPKTGLK